MEIHIDYNPKNHKPKNHFFVSIHKNNKECISFDNTIKGYRIVKQVLVEKKKLPQSKKISGSWITIIVKNRKFVRTYKVKWIDFGRKDWLNDEVWETVWEKPLSRELTKKILFYSQLISDNFQHLERYKREMKEFEKLLEKEIPNA